jgi:hypothetical protein
MARQFQIIIADQDSMDVLHTATSLKSAKNWAAGNLEHQIEEFRTNAQAFFDDDTSEEDAEAVEAATSLSFFGARIIVREKFADGTTSDDLYVVE